MIESREGARDRDVISSDSGKGLMMVSKRRILCGVSPYSVEALLGRRLTAKAEILKNPEKSENFDFF